MWIDIVIRSVSIAAVSLVLGMLLNQPKATAFGRDPCEPVDVPIQPAGDDKLVVVAHKISFKPYGGGALTLRNETGRTIARILVLVNYFDSNGDRIFSIPYFGGSDDQLNELMEVRPYVKTILKHPVEQGEVFTLRGDNLFSTRIMPFRADISMTDIEFTVPNNNVLVTSDDESADPLLTETPNALELDPSLVEDVDQLVVSVRLDERGRVADVSSVPQDRVSEKLSSDVKNQLKLWTFAPAMKNGWAVPSVLNLLLVFHNRTIPLPEPVCPLKLSESFPEVFVQVDFRYIGSSDWQIIYGGRISHGKFATIISVTS